ncbi:barstar family protein [Allosphingosinicella sp.]|jgi:RNAse (barnase) inhibitor barstar|uniref:barstar family protein n=1 Tax=Allosphingosinicella sp. TaxID=2823234 RepID=UPI002EED8509
MQRIELDGSQWQSQRDFYDALAAALGSVEWHGRNGNAFLETMVYFLELNAVQPPYEVVIRGAPDALRPFLADFASWVAEARRDRRDDPGWGGDVDVVVTVA